MPKTGTYVAASPRPATPPSKVQKKKLAHVESNTDPWHPPCETCMRRESSQFIFEENTIDMNEYIKAINYINAIHGLINETLLAKSSQGMSNLSVKANISMPDLPNFLTILTSINNLRQNPRANCQMISKTTSTSTLIKVDTAIREFALQVEDKTDNSENASLSNKQDFENDQNTSLEANSLNKQDNQITKNIQEGVPNSLSYELDSMDFRESCDIKTYYTVNDDGQVEECLYKQFSDAVPKQLENADIQHGLDKTNHMPVMPNKIVEQTMGSSDDHKKKPRTRSPICYHITTRGGCNKKDEVVAPSEPLLSEAELNKFASELLIGVEWESHNNTQKIQESSYVPVARASKYIPVQKLKTKSRTPQVANPEPVKRKLMQKPKEGALQAKEKHTSGIPVSQSSRPNSAMSSKRLSNSSQALQTKNKTCSSSCEPLKSPSFSGKKCSRNDLVAVGHGTEILAQELQFQLPCLNSITNRKASPKQAGGKTNRHFSSASLPAQNAPILIEPRRLKQRENTASKKTIITYHVQQKEDDDFLCPRRNCRARIFKQSSESVILSDKDDRITNFTDSDIEEDTCESNKPKVNKMKSPFLDNSGSNSSQNCLRSSIKKCSQNNLEGFPRKTSRNNLENMQHGFTSNERLYKAVSLKKRRDSRNKPFRQVRRQNGDNEEIINIRQYISQQKPMSYSDTNSNETGSSDIKSDKDCNVCEVLKTPNASAALVNYFNCAHTNM